ncbi:hypothetical protein C4J83_2613 [Pseudomonas sp. LBUM920]|nr:hypothetical protein C4J83_2613 [Pseudomonas sp. LBUM920]
MPDTPSCLHRRQASSYRKAKQCAAGSCTRSNCGSGLAREGGGSVTHELTDPPHSRASPLPHLDFCESDRWVSFALGQRWELACLRWHLLVMPDTPSCLHRRQASSYRKAKQCAAGSCTRSNCGSGLAREGGGPVIHELTEPPHSRASPLPHLDRSASDRDVLLCCCPAFASTTQVGY